MKNKIMAILLAITSAAIADDPKEAYDPYVLENAEEYNYYKKTAYAYAPATVYYEGQYHQFYCSTGGLTDMYYQPAAGDTYNSRVRFRDSWDHIRYRNSKNGSVWSNPVIAITQSGNPNNKYASPNDEDHENLPKPYFLVTNAENCACDPAIVKGDDGYWYLFYAGNIDYYNTVVYVARSKNIQGPYEKYYGDNKWDRQALVPVPILKKLSPKNFLWEVGPLKIKTYHPANDTYYYGIGQVSVVKYGGKFHVWFAEMSRDFDNNGYAMRYHVAVNNVTELENVDMNHPSQSSVKIDVLTHDNNIIDPSDNTHWHFSDFGEVRMSVSGKRGRFEMWVPNKYNDEGTSIIKYYSDNGIEWVLDKSYEEGPHNFIHNIGVSGDMHGFVYDNKYLLSFSGPTSRLDRIASDLIANGYESEFGGIDVTRGIWPMWQKLNNMQWSSKNISYKEENKFGVDKETVKKLTFFEGDFDGDGVYELGAVDLSSSKWYLRSSQSSNGKSSIWGKKFFTIDRNRDGNFKIVYGDFDGDGITDFGVVTYEKKDGVWSGYWKVHSSKTNSFGVPHIPDNWEWYGLSKDLDLLNGDYDGDGIVDLVAFLPSTKTWYMISSIDGDFMSFQRITRTTKAPRVKLFGYTEEDVKGNIIPVVGDFDGDRIADMTLVDVDKNLWYIRSSQTGEPMMLSHKEENPESWIPEKDWPRYMMRSVDSRGKPSNMNNVPSDMASYKFLPGDYDGDGITDQLVVKPTTGLGKMLLSRIKKSNVEGRKMMRLNAVRTESFPKAKNLTSKEFLVGDFDGNGYSDVCIVDTETYQYYIKFYGNKGSSKTTPYKENVKYAKIPTSPSLAKAHFDEHSKPEVAPAKPLPNFNVNVQEGMVIVTNASVGQKVSLFDIRGKEISHKVSDGRDVSFATPAKGMYIVRVGKTQRKVTIK